ncbi:MAG: hypothetical protein JSR45_10775 [Proteobacteria bacterium]|nr:hypothetical protein [Pseudomonadota bacterium]
MIDSAQIHRDMQSFDRTQRRRLLLLLLAAAAFVAIGLSMIRTGDQSGWGAVIFFGTCAIAMPMMLVRTYRKSRYTAGALRAGRQPIEAALGVLIGLGMALGSLAMAKFSPENPKALLIGYGGGGFFMLASASRVWRLFDGRPVIVVDAQGYFDRRAMRAPIRWAQVQAVSTTRIRGQLMFTLQTTAPDSTMSWTTRVADAFGFRPYNISATGLDCTQADLLVAIQQHSPQAFASCSPESWVD